MVKIAFVFPGQGSQYPGMGRALAENFEICRRAFEEADDALGFALSRLCFEGTEGELKLTENTQPALLATSVAAWRLLESRGLIPDHVAGHSLGEYSALVAAGGLSLADALRAVRKRGRYMQEAVPAGEGAMAAVIGMDRAAVEQLCRDAADGEVLEPANYNAPDQIVIAGSSAAVRRAADQAKRRGAKRVLFLQVSAPFHCSLMRPAAERLAHDLRGLEFKDLRFPLVTNVDASLIDKGEQARSALMRQVASPVRWQESIELLISRGVALFVEVGPGKVLSGLIKRIAPEARTYVFEEPAGLERVQSAFSEAGRL